MEGKYKRLGLIRTEYQKGGKVIITPPTASQNFDFKIDPINTRASKDNTTVVKPIDTNQIKKKKN